MNSKIGRLAAVLFAGWMSIAATAPAQEEHHASNPSHAWSYSGATGPEHWGDLSPEFAAILSFIILAEPITVSLVAGLVLVFVGIRLAQR